MNVLDDAHLIIKEAIDRAMPDNAVKAPSACPIR